MACYYPIPAKRGAARAGGEDYRPQLWPQLVQADLALPCGKCIGCKTANATHWAHRCQHEASQWDQNIFITLTYDDEHLPPNGALVPNELIKFIKRLRKHKVQQPVRYFGCGEYGTLYQRPHYHLLTFNCDFPDRYQVGIRKGKAVYHSETLSQLWDLGTAEFGDAEPGAANYIAQYTLAKQDARWILDRKRQKQPPFLRMSRKPPIGSRWLEQYRQDLTHGYLIENGTKHAIPRAYLKKLEQLDPELHNEITSKKEEYIRQIPKERNTVQELEAKNTIHKAAKSQTARTL